MKKEEFEALGLSTELAAKAEKASEEELKGYVAKSQYDEAVTAKGTLEKDLKARDKQLDDLKKASGDSEALQQQIADLQAANKAAKEKYDAEMQDLRLASAVKVAVAGSAHDADIVADLIDKSKLLLSDDGKVTGLDEQVKALKESKAFLFKADQSSAGGGQAEKKAAYSPKAGETNTGSLAQSIAESLNKAGTAADNPYAKAWG